MSRSWDAIFYFFKVFLMLHISSGSPCKQVGMYTLPSGVVKVLNGPLL